LPRIAPFRCHWNIHNFMYSIGRDDAGDWVSNGNSKPHAQPLGTVNLQRRTFSVSILSHETHQARKAKGVVTVSVSQKNLAHFPRSDTICPLRLKL
jgi:hypothetical protein